MPSRFVRHRPVLVARTMASAQSLVRAAGLRVLSSGLPVERNQGRKLAPSVSIQPVSGLLPGKGGAVSTSPVLSQAFFNGGAGQLSLRAHITTRTAASWQEERNIGGSVRCQSSVAEAEAPVEKFEYQAEVSRLLDLIVHSLYSHKEVFLRELVSNASDALDKLRFLSVTEPELMSAAQDLAIRIKADPDAGTITIQDTGIGMTKEDLVNTLGTIAQSGTAKFVQALKEKKEEGGAVDSNLIGQFGVGFYSAFLVADRVTVSTKSPRSDKQWVWEAEAEQNSFTISEETDPSNFLPRGTSITLHLKEDEKVEYASPSRIQGLVKNYSQFISFPIYTWQEMSREKEVEYEEPGKEGEEPVKKTKKVSETYFDWELTNETKPIWMRMPKEIAQEEYNSFFKNTFKEFIDPMAHTHFTTEGEIEFRSLLFIPGMPPFNENMMEKPKNIRLYVKRVFISDEFDTELFPRYFNFVKGVVDSNDLPLNVSREILQESRIVRIMRKRLVRKTFDMIDEIASREKEAYNTFWESFGKNIKYGCIEDAGNHKRLAPLLRFYSSKSEEQRTSLAEYVERMPESQSAIYYLAAENINSAKSAPFLEKLTKKGSEVLFLLDAIDEPVMTTLARFQDKKLVDVTKEDLDLGETVDPKTEEEEKKETQLLCDWMKQQLGDKVAKVQISKRIESSPCVLVAGKFGLSANMEKLMRAQMASPEQIEFQRQQRILEINPTHPIIKDLNVQCKDAPNSAAANRLLSLLYETALLSSGFSPDNPAEFGSRVYEMMAIAIAKQQEERAEIGQMVKEQSEAQGSEEVVEASEIRTEGDPWKQ